MCAIVGCTALVLRPGMKTCCNPSHQAVEKVHMERGQSRFQLQERLARARVAHPSDSLGGDVNPSIEAAPLEEDVDEEVEDFSISPNGITLRTQNVGVSEVPNNAIKLKAQFSRKHTHNEQVFVAPCGIIITRETFYGAEAVGSVVVSVMLSKLYRPKLIITKEMIKRTYRIKGTMPEHIFFDNNCQLAKMVQNDPEFANIGLSVDIFHFKSKHKITDVFCQTRCNPAAFPELRGEGNKAWYFNSSIAEQTNVWLGGYHSICREMLVDKYNFFLDEMILRRNRMTREKLAASGCMPNTWEQL